MDRRMYRGGMGRNVPSYRPNDTVCGDRDRFSSDDMCERDKCDNEVDRFPIGMSYVPWQCFRDLYENEFVALANGTLFKELNLGWYGRSCK